MQLLVRQRSEVETVKQQTLNLREALAQVRVVFIRFFHSNVSSRFCFLRC
jgi:hypothetical protein